MSDKYPSQLAERFQVRMPEGLRDQIRNHADANNRSMNAEIIALLEKGLRDADYLRILQGLEPFGELTEEETDRLLLGLEDTDRRLAARAKVLADHGVDDVLHDVTTRLARIEAMLADKS
nr:Arc family DNA-binding protein [Agrobacterium sp. Ap1]